MGILQLLECQRHLMAMGPSLIDEGLETGQMTKSTAHFPHTTDVCHLATTYDCQTSNITRRTIAYGEKQLLTAIRRVSRIEKRGQKAPLLDKLSGRA